MAEQADAEMGAAPAVEVSDEDLAATLRVLEALSRPAALEALGGKRFRALRKASAGYALQLERQKYDGLTYVQYVRKRDLEKQRRSQLDRLRRKDREYINSVKLRADRIEALQSLIEPQYQAPRITRAGEESKGQSRLEIEAPAAAGKGTEAGAEEEEEEEESAGRKRKADASASDDDAATAAAAAAAAGADAADADADAAASKEEDGKKSKKRHKKQKRGKAEPREVDPNKPLEPAPGMHKRRQAGGQKKLKAPSSPSVVVEDGVDSDEEPPLEDFVESKSSHHPASQRREYRPRTDEELQREIDEGNVHFPRSCYVCKVRFHRVHHFYCSLCPKCAALNWAKRNQKADLTGRYVLLTGGRVKIGFESGRRLLECGATVIITTRFPHDCAERFSKCEGFDEWKSRLHVFGLDLRDLRSVVRFTDLLQQRYPRLDAIVNNAAQTIRRPPAYYRHLLETELAHPTQRLEGVVQQDDLHGTGAGASSALPTVLAPHVVLPDDDSAEHPAAAAEPSHGVTVTDADDEDDDAEVEVDASAAAAAAAAPKAEAEAGAGAGAGPAAAGTGTVSRQKAAGALAAVAKAVAAGTVPAAAAAPLLSQLAVAPGDADHPAEHFPEGRRDVTGQQLDLRTVNSWLLKLDQVDPTELVEVFAVNALAPFILNSRLKAMMMRTGPSVDKYIINVSAMEGKFYRHKGPEHPHTNMAKAALNMMTRTSAGDYARDHIYMNAVDTGWINDENPHEAAERIAKDNNFQTPIDEMDAMARVIDLILVGVRTGANPYGQFFKDFYVSEW